MLVIPARVKVIVVMSALALAALALAGASAAKPIDDADHGGRPLSTELTGAAEVPGPGDPDGSGTATITVNLGQEEVCWEINAAEIVLPAAAAHIHIGTAGEAGPVVVPLSAPDASGFSSGCTTVDRALAKDILKNPEDYYVNVHTSVFPAGAIRGQLSK